MSATVLKNQALLVYRPSERMGSLEGDGQASSNEALVARYHDIYSKALMSWGESEYFSTCVRERWRGGKSELALCLLFLSLRNSASGAGRILLCPRRVLRLLLFEMRRTRHARRARLHERPIATIDETVQLSPRPYGSSACRRKRTDWETRVGRGSSIQSEDRWAILPGLVETQVQLDAAL